MALAYRNTRRSWLPWVNKDRKMNNDEATFWLSQFIGKNLRIHASDGRVFGGQMKCTDKVSLTLPINFGRPEFPLSSSQKYIWSTKQEFCLSISRIGMSFSP